MSPERWENLKGELKDKFILQAEGAEEFDDMPGGFEYVEFSGPMGEIRLEYITRPAVTGKKTIGASKRMGSKAEVEYEYSATDEVHKLEVFKKNEASGEWEEVKSSMFSD